MVRVKNHNTTIVINGGIRYASTGETRGKIWVDVHTGKIYKNGVATGNIPVEDCRPIIDTENPYSEYYVAAADFIEKVYATIE